MTDENYPIPEKEMIDHRGTFFGVIDISKTEGKYEVIRFPFNDSECAFEVGNPKPVTQFPWSDYQKFESRIDAVKYADELEEGDLKRVDEEVEKFIAYLNSLPRMTMQNGEYIKGLLSKIQTSVL